MQTDASNVTLTNLFANKCFRIPNYQRGYAWGESQLNDIWDDIMDIKRNNEKYQPHYTGAITLQQIEFHELNSLEKKLSTKGMEFYNVVDGQQRLTTIVIMINELAKRIKTGKNQLINDYIQSKNVSRFGYVDIKGNNYKFFMKNIIGDINTLPYVSTIYTENLEFASKFFEQKFSNLKPQELKKFQEKIFTALVFDTKYIQNNLDVQAVFETMNNRGKPLTTLEKLKNRLLYMTSKFDASQVNIDQLSTEINDAWGIIYETLGKNKDCLLNEDEFLSAYLTLLREPADYAFSESMAEIKVFQMFCNHANKYDFSMARQHDESIKEPIVDENKIRTFVCGIAHFVGYWYNTYFPNTKTTGGLHVKKVQFLNGSKEMRIFLAQLLMMKDSQNNLVEECLEKTEKVLFKNALPIASILDERRFATRARDLYNGELKLEKINTELDGLLSMSIDVQSLIGGFRYLFSYMRGNIGFHRWGALKFFLMEYENHIKGIEFSHVKWDDYNNVQIEHVMPRTWSTHWKEEMENYLNAHKSLNNEEIEKAKKILINSLGNLTIIKDIKNAGIGNNPWETKKEAYKKGSCSEIEIATNNSWSPWGHASIKSRGEKMLIFLCDYLKHNNSTTLTIRKDSIQDDYANILFYEAKYS